MPNHSYRSISQWLLLSLSCFLLTTTVFGYRYSSVSKFHSKTKMTMVGQPMTYQGIDGILVRGSANVQITGGKHKTRLTYYAPHNNPDSSIQQPNTWVYNHMLFIDTGDTDLTANNSYNIRLSIPTLKRLYLQGHINLLAKNFRSHNLTLLDNSTGQVHLNSLKLDVATIVAEGQGTLNALWLKTNKLRLIANKREQVHLAGVCKQLFARLTDYAQLDAQFLRTKYASVQTLQYSKASIFPLRAAQVFAYNNSEIKLYHKPKNLNRYSHDYAHIFMASYRP